MEPNSDPTIPARPADPGRDLPGRDPSDRDPAALDASALDPRRRRILFRATHRGTHETDLLVGGFVRERIAGFDAAELDAIEEAMELPDADLADWLMGRRPIPPDVETPMLRAMLDAAQDVSRARPLRDIPR